MHNQRHVFDAIGNTPLVEVRRPSEGWWNVPPEPPAFLSGFPNTFHVVAVIILRVNSAGQCRQRHQRFQRSAHKASP